MTGRPVKVKKNRVKVPRRGSEESRSERHRRPFGQTRIAHSADNRRYYLMRVMSRGTNAIYVRESPFRDWYVRMVPKNAPPFCAGPSFQVERRS